MRRLLWAVYVAVCAAAGFRLATRPRVGVTPAYDVLPCPDCGPAGDVDCPMLHTAIPVQRARIVSGWGR